MCKQIIRKEKSLQSCKSYSDYQNNGGKWGLKIIGSGEQHAKLLKMSKIINKKIILR